MRNILGTLAALASLLLVGLTAGPANADPRAGYAGDDGVVVNISGATLIGGEVVNVEIAATRTVDGVPEPVVCDTVSTSTVPDLVESFSGGGAASYDVDLDTEVVAERTPTTISVVCDYTPISALGETGVASATTASLTLGPNASTGYSGGDSVAGNSNTITLLPVGSAGNGDRSGLLPTTGTEIGLWLLAVGGLLVVGGLGVAVAARRRKG